MEKGKFTVKLIIEACTDKIESTALLTDAIEKYLRLKPNDVVRINGLDLQIRLNDAEVIPLSIEVCPDNEANLSKEDDLDFLNKTAWEKQARDAMRKENERYSEVVRLRAALQLVHDYQFMELDDFRSAHPELMGLETNGAIHIAVWHKVRELLRNTGEQK